MSTRNKKGTKKKKNLKKATAVPTFTLPALVKPAFTLPPVKSQSYFFTVTCGQTASLNRMINHFDGGKMISVVDPNGSSALHLATRTGNISMLEQLISMGSLNINAREDSRIGGYCALHLACKEGQEKMVELLIKYGADVNLVANTALAESPLHICCKTGTLTCARLLIKAGADINMKDGFGHNATFWATVKQHFEMIKELPLPPMHTATAKEHLEIMKRHILNFSIAKAAKGKKKGKKVGQKKKANKT